MGYDLTRFVGDIDKEFVCLICKLVLDNPVQIPCDHTFCYECIKSHITVERACPVDLVPITLNGETSVFKPPCMAFRNLLYKLNMICDFQSFGCLQIVKMENLVDHVRSCEFNSNAEVVCNKGCSLKITRRELSTSCYTHLKQENTELNHRVMFQKKQYEGLANCLYDRIKKLNDELSLQRAEHLQTGLQKQQLANLIRRQQQEIAFLRRKQLTSTPLKWQICHNMKVDESNNLEIDDLNSSPFAFVQSYYPLKSEKHSFRIQLSKSSPPENSSEQRNLIWIGLTRKGHAIARNAEAGSIVCIWNGRIQLDNEFVASSSKWIAGDFIKVGIDFTESFTSECDNSAIVHVHKNEELCFDHRMEIPHEGFFPTVCIYGGDTTVKFEYN